MVIRKFLLLVTICILLSPLPHCPGEELLDKVAITKIEFFQKGKLVEVVTDDAPVRIRAYLKAEEMMAEFRDKFLLIFYLNDLPVRTYPISDIKYTPFIDYLWEKPTSGLHSIGASLGTPTAVGERVYYDMFIEEVKPALKINSLEIDTTRRLEVGDKVKFFLFVSNDSEKVILPDDFVVRLQLKAKEVEEKEEKKEEEETTLAEEETIAAEEEKEKERIIFLELKETPRIGAKAHNVSLGPIEWVVEDGNWLIYPEILPRVTGSGEVLQVVKVEEVSLDLRIGESRPDLFVELSLSPPSPYMGEDVEILAGLENRGDLPCEKYRLSLYVDGRRKGSIMEGPTILPGKSQNLKFLWRAERGTHYLKVSAAYEFDEREFLTKAELPLNINTGINLVPVILSWKPVDPQSGDIVTILARIENIGVSPITPWHEGSEVGYRAILSVDGIRKQVKFDGDIGPGEKSDFELTWEAEEGEHLLEFSSLYVVAKDIEPILWSDEESIKVLPPPELVCVRDSWTPSPPTEGDTVEVSLVVRNDGKGVARLWDEEEMVGYKVVFSIGSEEREVSKRIPPGKEVTLSFRWKVDEGGEYPVRVLFIHPSGKGIVKPYKGTLTVLSSEPIDELEKETLKLLEKVARKKASLYRSLGKSLEELLRSPSSQFGKVAKKTSKIALDTLKSIFEERQTLPFSDKSLEDKDLLQVSKNLKEIMEDIDRTDWKSIPLRGEKLEYEYGNLRNYLARSILSEGGAVPLLEKEAASYRQMEANNSAVEEGRVRPYPDAKNELLKVLKAEEKLGIDIYQDFQKEKSVFTFVKREAERDKGVRIRLGILKSMISMLRNEGLRAGNLQREFYAR
ncbi:MAG: CARDB domain-containing protein [bacterium]